MDWTDITLKQYLKYKNVMYSNSYDNENDKLFDVIGVLYDADPYKMPLADFHKCAKEVNKLISKPMPKTKVRDTFKGKHYNYQILKDLSKMKVSQFVDWSNYVKDGGSLDNAPALLSVFFIPEGMEYGEGYDIADVQSDIEEMPIPFIISVLAFFLLLSKAYTVAFLRFSQKQTEKAITDKEKKKKLKKMYRNLILQIVGME